MVSMRKALWMIPMGALLAATSACFNRVGVSQPPNVPMANLAIRTQPANAEILIDGRFVGDSPATVVVSPSQHTVEVEKAGYAAWRRTIYVQGWHAHLKIHLRPNSTTAGQ